MRRHDTAVHGLKNIGPTIAARLAAVGINSVGDLRGVGPAGAFKRLQRKYPAVTIPVCYYLYCLQGALDGVHWDALSPAVKDRLLEQAGVKRPRRR